MIPLVPGGRENLPLTAAKLVNVLQKVHTTLSYRELLDLFIRIVHRIESRTSVVVAEVIIAGLISEQLWISPIFHTKSP